MPRTLSRIALAAAATSIAVMPVAAQAGTRAGDSAALYFAPVSVQIVNDDVSDPAAWTWDDTLIALLGVTSVVAILILIDGGKDQSPGT